MMLAHALMLSACVVMPMKWSQDNAAGKPGASFSRPVSAEKATPHVRLPFDLELELRVHLEPRETDSLDQFLKDVEDPKSAYFHRYLTPREYQDKFGATHEDAEDVKDHLRAHGITVESRGHHSMLYAKGTVRSIEAAFGTTLHRMQNEDGQYIHAPLTEPAFPKHLRIASVDGLASKPAGQSHLRTRWFGAQPPLAAKTIRSAYNMPAAALGSGQIVGMLELDGYDDADLDTYAQEMGIRRVPTTNILIGGYDGSIQDSGAQVEVTMDIELANALAPNLAEIRVYATTNGEHGMTDILHEMANPTLGDKALVRVLSCSWGMPEDQMSFANVAAENVILKQMAAQGQTLFVAAGDSGARDDGTNVGTDDPASQPFAVGVGGTTLHVDSSGNYKSESTWSGGGGGISRFWRVPTWQKTLESRSTRGSWVRRNVPDVALNADPVTGYNVYVAGNWQSVGGTSCAAPLWAAFLATANQTRIDAKKTPFGFFAPIIYQVAQSPAGKAGFHDIADNSTNGFYPAVTGLDDATGWGSFNGSPLLQALTALP